jgi:predicted NodU family carbamoyl transferase
MQLKNVWIQPAAEDAGGALGAALAPTITLAAIASRRRRA